MSEGPAGVIIGGWPYVIAAYSITAAALVVNFARLAKRERQQGSDHKESEPDV